MSDYDGDEPVLGLPAKLPQGERILWQGSPDRWGMACRAFHVRQLAIYFAVLLAWYGITELTSGGALLPALLSFLTVSGCAVGAVALLAGIGWLTARSTVYTITNKRVAMRFGIALPMTVNIPFAMIESAALKTAADGSGDLVLRLAGSQKLAYVLLWPHARPWQFKQPQPMLRAVSGVSAVAQILARALAASANTPVQAVPDAANASAVPSRPHAAAAA